MTFILLATALAAALEQGAALAVPPLAAPTKDAVTPTEAEMVALRAGYALFREKKFDEAIAAFQAMLSANPDSVGAMYEMALSLHAKGDASRAIGMAARCAEYRFPELDKCLALVGSVLDLSGQPALALEAYDKAIAILPNAGTLHYNKAVTEMQSLKDVPRALATLKRGAAADPRHATTHQLLGRFFLADDLRTPGLLALSRFLILEPASSRTGEVFKIWYTLLNGNVKQSKDGKLEVALNPNKKTHEGDLMQLDLFIALSQIDAANMPAATPPGPRLVQQFTTYLNAVAKQEPGPDAPTFLWSHYLPYFKELHSRKFTEAFIYHVSQSAGMPGVAEWLEANHAQVEAFLSWDKAFAWR